jgi:hypothetical protein
MHSFHDEIQSAQAALDRLMTAIEAQMHAIANDGSRDVAIVSVSDPGKVVRTMQTTCPYPHAAVGTVDDYAQDSR